MRGKNTPRPLTWRACDAYRYRVSGAVFGRRAAAGTVGRAGRLPCRGGPAGVRVWCFAAGGAARRVRAGVRLHAAGRLACGCRGRPALRGIDFCRARTYPFCQGPRPRRDVALPAAGAGRDAVPAAHPCAAQGKRHAAHRSELLRRHADAPGVHRVHCPERPVSTPVSPAGRGAPVRLPVFVRDRVQRVPSAGGRAAGGVSAADGARLCQRIQHVLAVSAADAGQRGQGVSGVLSVFHGQRVRFCLLFKRCRDV